MKHKPISKKLREEVYKKYNGHCAYCGCELEYKDMQVDHIESLYSRSILKPLEENQNDDISNLMPSCRMCNYYKAADTLDGFRYRLTNILMPNVQKPFDYRLALKYDLIEEHMHQIEFYFEKIDKEHGV